MLPPRLRPRGPSAQHSTGTVAILLDYTPVQGYSLACPKAQASTAIPSTADASAKIALSSGAASLIAGGSNTEFDAEKVARISQSIDDGTFKINAEVIADKLIANAQELLVKKRCRG